MLQKHIVDFVDMIKDDEGLVLIMKYMPLGNLKEVHEQARLSREEICLTLRQALLAMEYLHHEKEITHRDIKPENILVRSRSPEFLIKLCDFGLSTEKTDQVAFCGTLLYTAPELHKGQGYTSAVDIWAIGVVILQLIRNLPNSQKVPSEEWCLRISRRAQAYFEAGNGPIASLLTGMLRTWPFQRPSAQGCLKDPSMAPLPQFLQVQAACSLQPSVEKLKELKQPRVQPQKRLYSAFAIKEESLHKDDRFRHARRHLFR